MLCAGYYGLPEDPEGFCTPCFCNNNINTTDPAACNNANGLCELCLDNTSGDKGRRQLSANNYFNGHAC